MLLINACRKTDIKPEQVQNNELASKFFNSHTSTDPHIQALNKFLKAKNEKYNFIRGIVKKVGFPYWNKSLSVSKAGSQVRNLTENETLTYIPFVRDSQFYVNASLVIKTTPTDTTYQFLCDWQYSSFGYDTTNTGWNALNVFHVFTRLDNSVFNRNKFRITDENLLSQNVRNSLAGMGLPFDSANITYMLKEPSGGTAGRSHLWTLVTWCDDYDICIKAIDYTWLRSNATTSSSLPCSSGTLLTVTICTDTWEYIPSSGGGGGTGGNSGGNTGGGGSSGGSTPPGCEGGVPANRSSLYQNPCEPGWVPVDEPTINQMLQSWDDSIILHFTVRPCIENILNKIRDTDSGTVAKIITVLSGNTPGFDWEIEEVPQINPPHDPLANAVTAFLPNYRRAITWLNNSRMQNATNIMVAQTLLHEAVHAFLYDYYHNSLNLPTSVRDSLLGLPYVKLLKDFMKKKESTASNLHHNIMINSLRNHIKNALKNACLILGFNLTGTQLEEFCSDMSWGGLNEDQSPTSAWMDPSLGLTDEDRARITKRLDIELNNLGNFSGTYGGYYLNIPQIGTKACP